MRNRWWATAGLAAAAIVLAGCGSSGSSTPPTSGGNTSATTPATTSATGIKTVSTSKGTVLANSAGHTLYWFAIDTSTASKCSGTCLTYWPPVYGKQVAASGVTLSGTFGTITRSDGKVQATYNGHPLYTYVGDTAAGQVNGNGKNLSGGLWWAMTPSGAKLAAPAPSSSPTSGGGYGY